MPQPKFREPSEGSALEGGEEQHGVLDEKPQQKRAAPNPEIQALAGKPIDTPEDKSPVQAAELAAQLEAALANEESLDDASAELKDIQVEDVGDPEKKVERREVTAANTHRPWRSGVTSEATARLGSLPWRPSRDHTTNTLAGGVAGLEIAAGFAVTAGLTWAAITWLIADAAATLVPILWVGFVAYAAWRWWKHHKK